MSGKTNKTSGNGEGAPSANDPSQEPSPEIVAFFSEREPLPTLEEVKNERDPRQKERREQLPPFPDPMALAHLAIKMFPKRCQQQAHQEELLWEARRFYDLACDVATASDELSVLLRQAGEDEDGSRLLTFTPNDLNNSSYVRHLDKRKAKGGYKSKRGFWRLFIEKQGTPNSTKNPTAWTIDRKLVDGEIDHRLHLDVIRVQTAKTRKQPPRGGKA